MTNMFGACTEYNTAKHGENTHTVRTFHDPGARPHAPATLATGTPFHPLRELARGHVTGHVAGHRHFRHPAQLRYTELFGQDLAVIAQTLDV